MTAAAAPAAVRPGAVRDCPACGSARHADAYVKDGHALRRCGDCGLVYVGADPSTIDFAALYGAAYYAGGSDAVFADYVGQEAARRAQARRKLFALRHRPRALGGAVPRAGRLLDVGCAAGFFLAEARRFYAVQGVEFSAWSSAWARDHLGLPVLTGTLQQAALPAGHYDLVTLWDVIEHVADPVPLLAEVARVLAPRGRVVLTTGDAGSAYARRHGAGWHLVTPPWHLSLFDRPTLARAAGRAGLRVVHVASEGVAGDGRFWRSRPGLVLGRLLDRGDILRATLAHAADAQ